MGDPNSLGSRWTKWKRALEIYFEATNIKEPTKKRATLLHTGGLVLQEIYYNIPGAHIDESPNVDVYKVAINKLNDYFSPKQSFVYERHLFRLMKQEQGEKFEKFLIRLRNQAKKCNFDKIDDHLIDQIAEKCLSPELRKRILILGDSVTVDKTVSEANAIETVDRQLSDFQKKSELGVNRIFTERNTKTPNGECTSCGSKYHKNNDKSCPATGKICAKCGRKGHFKKQCRTRASKRVPVHSRVPVQSAPNQGSAPKKPKLDSSEKPDTKINYIFHIDDDTEVICYVGGVPIKMLVDSGSKCNILSENTWKYLKSSSVEVSNQQKQTDKIFFGYGSKGVGFV